MIRNNAWFCTQKELNAFTTRNILKEGKILNCISSKKGEKKLLLSRKCHKILENLICVKNNFVVHVKLPYNFYCYIYCHENVCGYENLFVQSEKFLQI